MAKLEDDLKDLLVKMNSRLDLHLSKPHNDEESKIRISELSLCIVSLQRIMIDNCYGVKNG